MATNQGVPGVSLAIKEGNVLRREGQQCREIGHVFRFRGKTPSPLMAHRPQPLMPITPGDTLRRRYRREKVRQRTGIRGDRHEP